MRKILFLTFKANLIEEKVVEFLEKRFSHVEFYF